jgi:23S rRNA pseudouridine1911/1915/1917 synthase
MIQFEVPSELSGARADLVVARLADLPRSTVSELFLLGSIGRSDEQPLRRSDKLIEGTSIWVIMPEPPPGLEPVPMDFKVLFEDEAMAVVEKPAGLVTHPGAGTVDPTLASGVLARWPQVEGVGAENRWGLVHRLDKETSGALLVAKTADAYDWLTAELAARRIGRTYRALCHGLLEFGSGTVDAPIGRDRQFPTRFAVDATGRPARTHYERLTRWPEAGVTMARVNLETGRTHQIRVHMKSIGHPIVGDKSYGGEGPELVDPGRVWLHAEQLEFVDLGGDRHQVSAPMPLDLRESLARLGSGLGGP